MAPSSAAGAIRAPISSVDSPPFFSSDDDHYADDYEVEGELDEGLVSAASSFSFTSAMSSFSGYHPPPVIARSTSMPFAAVTPHDDDVDYEESGEELEDEDDDPESGYAFGGSRPVAKVLHNSVFDEGDAFSDHTEDSSSDNPIVDDSDSEMLYGATGCEVGDGEEGAEEAAAVNLGESQVSVAGEAEHLEQNKHVSEGASSEKEETLIANEPHAPADTGEEEDLAIALPVYDDSLDEILVPCKGSDSNVDANSAGNVEDSNEGDESCYRVEAASVPSLSEMVNDDGEEAANKWFSVSFTGKDVVAGFEAAAGVVDVDGEEAASPPFSLPLFSEVGSDFDAAEAGNVSVDEDGEAAAIPSIPASLAGEDFGDGYGAVEGDGRVVIIDNAEAAERIMAELAELTGYRDDSTTADQHLLDTAALAALLREVNDSSPVTSSTEITGDVPKMEMNSEVGRMREKVEQMKVDYLRLVHRLGYTPDHAVVARVLYRLSIAEGLKHAAPVDEAWSKASQLEDTVLKGNNALSFTCNILVLGKRGYGKTATINSLFGEEKAKADAFGQGTTCISEIVGVVDGIRLCVVDTPGLDISDLAATRKMLLRAKKFVRRCQPDMILYVDRLDSPCRDFVGEVQVMKLITEVFGLAIWFNATVALTHSASSPLPDMSSGSLASYETSVSQRFDALQQAIQQAVGGIPVTTPLALVENHPSSGGVLPNGVLWRPQLLLLCYSSKILADTDSHLNRRLPAGKLFGFHGRYPPLAHFLSCLLQSRMHPRLAADDGIHDSNTAFNPDELFDGEKYDNLPPFKPLQKAELEKLTTEQKRAYADEFDYRVKLMRKQQLAEEFMRLTEMKKNTGSSDFDSEDDVQASIQFPMPDMTLPLSFDSDTPSFRYRCLEPAATFLARPVFQPQGWDHDCGFDGVDIEHRIDVVSRFPAVVNVQVAKGKDELIVHLESSVAAKHRGGGSMAGLDVQSIGKQLAYVFRGETRVFRTTGGISATLLSDTVSTGGKLEHHLPVGKRLALVVSAGAVSAWGAAAAAYGANVELRLRDRDFPLGLSPSTLSLSVVKLPGCHLSLGGNVQKEFVVVRGSKTTVRAGVNSELSGQITVKTSTSDLVQIALVALVPMIAALLKSAFASASSRS